METNCPLCQLYNDPQNHLTTKLYYFDSEMIIVDCRTCGVPMAVYCQHKAMAPDEARNRMVRDLVKINPAGRIDDNLSQIKDHYHIHLR